MPTDAKYSKLSSFDAELEKDRCKGVEMRELNDTENLLHRSFLRKSLKLSLFLSQIYVQEGHLKIDLQLTDLYPIKQQP